MKPNCTIFCVAEDCPYALAPSYKDAWSNWGRAPHILNSSATWAVLLESPKTSSSLPWQI